MSKKKSKIKHELDETEKKELVKWFGKQDKRLMQAVAESVSMMVRAFEGRPVEPDDIITRLTNVKNILERSRFPTYALLAKQVYLRLVGEFYRLPAFTRWADLEAQALISYKGLSRQEYTEQMKAASGAQDTQQVVFGQHQAAPSEPKRRFAFLRRKPKQQPESEFEYQ